MNAIKVKSKSKSFIDDPKQQHTMPTFYRPALQSQTSLLIHQQNDLIYKIYDDSIPFTPSEILYLYNLKTTCAVRNYEVLHDSVSELEELIEKYFYTIYYPLKKRQILIQQYLKDRQNIYQELCLFAGPSKQEIIEKLFHCQSKTEVLIQFDRYFEQYNMELMKIWSEFLSSIRKAMPLVRDLLKYEYDAKIRRFWKKQIIVQTCR